MNLFKKLILPLLVLVLLSSGISFLLHHQKVAQAQSAATASCGSTPADVVLVLDRSYSMREKIGTTTVRKIDAAKTAGKKFVDLLAGDAGNQAGSVFFGDHSTPKQTLTTSWAAVKTAIDYPDPSGNTCAECAVQKAGDELKSSRIRPGNKHVMIFLTDGKANVTIASDGKQVSNVTTAENAALNRATTYKNQNITIFTIGLGDNTKINPEFLKKLASKPEYYFDNPKTEQELQAIYNQIYQIIAGGTISGYVYNDADNSASKGSSEAGLSGWTVTLNPGNKTTTSGNDGSYSFSDLCSQTYTLSETPQPQNGWTQTEPSGGTYTIILNSTTPSVSGKNFGNFQRPACNLGTNGETTGDCTPCTTSRSNNCEEGNGTKSCEINRIRLPNGSLSDQCNPHTNNQVSCRVPNCSAGFHCNENVTPFQCVPDPTPEPGQVQLNFVLGLDGIGGPDDPKNVTENVKGTGDFSNRNQTFGTTDPKNFDKTPLNTIQGAKVCLYPNAQNDTNFCTNPYPVDLHFNGSTQLWTGTLPLPNTITPGNYSIKIWVKKYLIRKVGLDIPTTLPNLINTSNQNAIWNLVEGANQIGTATNQKTHSNLMVGDIDGTDFGDNALTSLDWTIIKDCLDPQLFTAVTAGHCTSSAKADLNADGKVNENDLNYFIRERSTGDGGLPQANSSAATTTPTPSPSLSPSPSINSSISPSPSASSL